MLYCHTDIQHKFMKHKFFVKFSYTFITRIRAYMYSHDDFISIKQCHIVTYVRGVSTPAQVEFVEMLKGFCTSRQLLTSSLVPSAEGSPRPLACPLFKFAQNSTQLVLSLHRIASPHSTHTSSSSTTVYGSSTTG